MRSRGNIARDLWCWELVTSGTRASHKSAKPQRTGGPYGFFCRALCATSEKTFRPTVCFIALLYHGKSQACVGESIAVPHGKITRALPTHCRSADRSQQFLVARTGHLWQISHLHGTGKWFADL